MITRRLYIFPRKGDQLYGFLVRKELELRQKNKGTFYRASTKKSRRSKWMHSAYPGWIKMQKTVGGGIAVEVRAKGAPGKEWQIIHAFLGFLDRHFADKIQAVSIQYL